MYPRFNGCNIGLLKLLLQIYISHELIRVDSKLYLKCWQHLWSNTNKCNSNWMFHWYYTRIFLIWLTNQKGLIIFQIKRTLNSLYLALTLSFQFYLFSNTVNLNDKYFHFYRLNNWIKKILIICCMPINLIF